MALPVNIRLLEREPLRLTGELSPADLGLETRDPMIRAANPLQHDLDVQRLDNGLLITGQLELVLECTCVRCLKPFPHRIWIPQWTCHAALEGEEALPVHGDCVDLTPMIREDIFLEFPGHPLCSPHCGGLLEEIARARETPDSRRGARAASSAWIPLDKLKL